VGLQFVLPEEREGRDGKLSLLDSAGKKQLEQFLAFLNKQGQ
jgi:hypothetical protein